MSDKIGGIAPATDEALLVVDDNEMNRDMLGRRLQRAGYRVITAAAGFECLRIIDTDEIAVVLLDIEMPEMSGLDVLERLRRSYSPSELPVIMVTARSQSQDMVEALNAGANDYVTKPVDVPVALARIRTQIMLQRAERAVRTSEQRYALAVRGANDGLWDWDLKTGEVFLAPRWFSMLGLQGSSDGNEIELWLKRVHPGDLPRLRRDIDAHLEGGTNHLETEHRLLHGDGDYRWMLSRGLAIRDAAGRAIRMAGSLTDITDGKVVDPLTGLPNRLLFNDRVERCLERARRTEGYRFAVVLLDIDRFRVINDSLGPGAGDQILVAIAKRLDGGIRSSDTIARTGVDPTIARLGGDEFLLLFEAVKHAGDAATVTTRILRGLDEPFHFEGQEVFASASAGIVDDLSVAADAAEILRDADIALHLAKARGGSHYCVFDHSMRSQAMERLELETGLRRAVERSQLRVHYQPIVSLTDRSIRGFEALVRWQHPTRGLVSPLEFIPLAEETGLIDPIGQWVMREACRQIHHWRERYPRESPLVVSVNLSAAQVFETDLIDHVRGVLERFELDPSALKVELTESSVVENVEEFAESLGHLRALGIKVAIDDFGTGYSAFSHLQDLPADTVKLDRSFVSRIESSADSAQIVRSIIELAHHLGMETIAEGVETEHEARFLHEAGCELAQGFLFSRPVEASAATELLEAECGSRLEAESGKRS